MSTNNFDYDQIKKTLYQKNLNEVMLAAKEPVKNWLDFKIKSFCKTFDFSYDGVLRLIKENKYFAATFIMDPGRQNFYETQALKFIQSTNNIVSATKLSASGKQAKFVINGKLVGKKDVVNLETNKSIDFEVVLINTKKIYIAHKHTGEAGGAQDNQYHDLITFLNNANQYLGDDYFMAIADGNYYKTQFTSINGTRISKLEYLKRIANKSKVFATDIHGFQEIVDLVSK
jgi:hypothetical protein